MDTRVDFYVLSGEQPGLRMSTACRIAGKAWSNQVTVLVRVDDESTGKALDEMLWTWSDSAFLPHGFFDTADQDWTDYPVQVAYRPSSQALPDLLLNMGQSVPEDWQAYSRVIDIVPGDPAGKAEGRRRYKFFLDQGVEPGVTNLD